MTDRQNRYIQYLRVIESLDWPEIAKEVNDRFAIDLTPNACRKRHGRLSGLYAGDVSKPPNGTVWDIKDNTKDHETVIDLPSGGNVIIIADTHFPFVHPLYLDHCQRVRDHFKCDQVIHIGDVTDNYAVSRWDKDPAAMGVNEEWQKAREEMEPWIQAFPETIITLGNHCVRFYTRAFGAGLPTKFLKPYSEIWDTPKGWRWVMGAIKDGVAYEHGTGSSGKNAALNRAQDNMCSVVIGHVHTYPSVQWMSSYNRSIFGMNVGSGIDINAYAMAYGRNYRKKPTLGCGVVLNDGAYPAFVPMGAI